MSKTYTLATLNGLVIATVPDGQDVFDLDSKGWIEASRRDIVCEQAAD